MAEDAKNDSVDDAAQAATDDAQAQAADDDASQDGSAAADDKVDPRELAKLRSELKATRKEAAASRVKLKEFEDASLNDQQKAEQAKQAAEAKAEQLETHVRDLTAQVAASKLGVRAEAVGDIARLIDWSEIEDSSDTKQVEKAVRDLIKDRPYLSGRPGGLDGGAQRGRGQGKFSMNDLIRSAAGRNPAER